MKAPAKSELEVSVFGTGFGECIVAHLGNNDWLVVDSCIDPDSRRSVALDYLDTLDVDASCVKIVVASHWHADHIAGIAQVIDACDQARFVISPALRSDEARTFLAAHARNRVDEDLPVRDMYEALRIAAARAASSEGREVLQYASANRIIWERSSAGSAPKAIASTLSPSDFETTKALAQIIEQIPSERSTLLLPVTQRPNHLAIVIWLQLGINHVLLGSDLETTSDQRTGWDAVVRQISPTIRAATAILFKVPITAQAQLITTASGRNC